MKAIRKTLLILLVLATLLTLAAGCGTKIKDDKVVKDDNPEEIVTNEDANVPDPNLPDNPPEDENGEVTLLYVPEPDGEGYNIPEPAAPGTKTNSNSKALLDYSNTADGYVMVKYTGTNPKVKVQVTGPSANTYSYNIRLDGKYDVFPLSDGNGSYKLGVYENISGTSYSTAFSFSFSVSLKDEFEPFLRSNKYVNYTADSKVVKKAAELTKKDITELEKVKSVYNYVVSNFKYDYVLAKKVESGYVPDLDAVMDSKKGICFDYASVMTAMLRSQGVPTQLVFGYAGTAYHAWINVYSEKDGWVTAAIYFNGDTWQRMDPTFASTGKSSASILAYIGNGANYSSKYIY